MQIQQSCAACRTAACAQRTGFLVGSHVRHTFSAPVSARRSREYCVAAIATTSVGRGIAITAGAALMDAGPVATATSHAAHDIGILGADPALADAPSISMFGTEAAAIDAVNHDGGFGTITALNGTDTVWDFSVNGNIAVTDHVGAIASTGTMRWGFRRHEGHGPRCKHADRRDVRQCRLCLRP